MERERPKSTIGSGEAHASFGDESGFVMFAVVVILIPLVVFAGSMLSTMDARNDRLLDEISQERALLAAEAGVDEALYRASTSTGLSHLSGFSRTLGSDTSYSVVPRDLQLDGIDNDGDGLVDEADEKVFEVIVTGTYRRTTRRIAAYVGPVSIVAAGQAAIGVYNPSPLIEIQGSALVDGSNRKIDGTLGSAANDTYGLAISAPGTLGDLSAQITGSERQQVKGKGPDPSLGTILSPEDLNALVLEVKNSANVVLTSGEYQTLQFGNGPANDFKVVYREGSLTLKGNSRGAGILVVTGDLHMQGTARFDGVVVVLGHVELQGTAQIFGALTTGPASQHTHMQGNSYVQYSAEAVTKAKAQVPGKYGTFNGWQEIARQ